MKGQTAIINPRSLDLDMHRLGRRIRESIGDKRLIIKITEESEKRRDKQNRLLWVWHSEFVTFLYESRGEVVSAEHWHEKMVPQFLPSEPVKIKGEWFIPRRETKKLSVKEFADFLTRYEVEAANEGCNFTRPDELYWQAVMKDAA